MTKKKGRCRAYLFSYAEAMAYMREMDKSKKAKKGAKNP
jgi:cytochrome b